MCDLSEYSQKHECCPKEFRGVPNVTGHHELDVVIARTKNRNVPDRLKMFVEDDIPYGPKTAYSGYHGYTGDD